MLFWVEWYASLHLGVNISPGKSTSYLHAIFNNMSITAEKPKHSLQIKAVSFQKKLSNQNINGLAEEMNLNIKEWKLVHMRLLTLSFILIRGYYVLIGTWMHLFFKNKFDLKEFHWPCVLRCCMLCSLKCETVEAVWCKPAVKCSRKQSVKLSKICIF